MSLSPAWFTKTVPARHGDIKPVSKHQKLKKKKRKKEKKKSTARFLTLEVSLTLLDCRGVMLEIKAQNGDGWHAPVIPAFGR